VENAGILPTTPWSNAAKANARPRRCILVDALAGDEPLTPALASTAKNCKQARELATPDRATRPSLRTPGTSDKEEGSASVDMSQLTQDRRTGHFIKRDRLPPIARELRGAQARRRGAMRRPQGAAREPGLTGRMERAAPCGGKPRCVAQSSRRRRAIGVRAQSPWSHPPPGTEPSDVPRPLLGTTIKSGDRARL
jgi:hypothetical protein